MGVQRAGALGAGASRKAFPLAPQGEKRERWGVWGRRKRGGPRGGGQEKEGGS